MITKLKSIILGFLILLFIQFISNFIVVHFRIRIPSPLLGMIILSLLLYFNVISRTLIEDVCNILLKNMSLFFVPLFVGIISYVAIIKQNLLPIILTIFLTTFFTMLITALLVNFIMKVTGKSERYE